MVLVGNEQPNTSSGSLNWCLWVSETASEGGGKQGLEKSSAGSSTKMLGVALRCHWLYIFLDSLWTDDFFLLVLYSCYNSRAKGELE